MSIVIWNFNTLLKQAPLGSVWLSNLFKEGGQVVASLSEFWLLQKNLFQGSPVTNLEFPQFHPIFISTIYLLGGLVHVRFLNNSFETHIFSIESIVSTHLTEISLP